MKFYSKKDKIFKYLQDSLHSEQTIVEIKDWDALFSGNYKIAEDSTPNCFDKTCKARSCIECYYDFCKKFGIKIKK